MYSDTSAHDAEGLYDEPAFNANLKKANPVYESTENLAGAEPAYAETGPVVADGYLDVSPNTAGAKAEDVGYLGAPEDAGYLGPSAGPEDAGYLGPSGPEAEDVGYLGSE